MTQCLHLQANNELSFYNETAVKCTKGCFLSTFSYKLTLLKTK